MRYLFLEYRIPHNKISEAEVSILGTGLDPGPRHFHGSCLSPNARNLYIFGGIQIVDKQKKILNDLWSYNPRNHAWFLINTTSIFRPKFGLQIIHQEGLLWCLGGNSKKDGIVDVFQEEKPFQCSNFVFEVEKTFFSESILGFEDLFFLQTVFYKSILLIFG
jgi:hypothetical protein